MTYEDDLFNTFIVFGYICLLPFLIALGTILYPIVVGVWIYNYIQENKQ